MRNEMGSVAVWLMVLGLPVQSAMSESVQAQVLQDRKVEADRLLEKGNQLYQVSQYREALKVWEQALQTYREIKDRNGEGNSLSSLGNAYYSLGQYQKAIEYYQQSLAIKKQIGDRNGQGDSLNNLGNAYNFLGQYQKAIEYHQQSLAISKQIGDRNGEGDSLGNLGNAYNFLGQYQKAIEYYQQSLAIKKQIGDRNGQGDSLSNLGQSFAKQNQPELAILFYKQSVNVRETIRKDIGELSQEEQKSYLNTIAYTYRFLANLLVKQGRIMEALQILNLLKVQELEDYFKNIKGNDRTAQGGRLLGPERVVSGKWKVLRRFSNSIAIWQTRSSKFLKQKLTGFQSTYKKSHKGQRCFIH